MEKGGGNALLQQLRAFKASIEEIAEPPFNTAA
jgi:hypothetical protein